jgi:indole-3-glycerol phosphate synthase
LKVVPERFAALAPSLPEHLHCVAESGVATPADALSMRRLGYRLALIGAALMGSDHPAELLAAFLRSARTVRA